jgi:hypothetical protein
MKAISSAILVLAGAIMMANYRSSDNVVGVLGAVLALVGFFAWWATMLLEGPIRVRLTAPHATERPSP